jgi:2,5-diamino-6-(ribosylamino)-4(3H)-pyrimidinone 5'-phosphate reductase
MQRPRVVIHVAQTVDARISFRRGPSKRRWEDVIASETPNSTLLWGRVLREKIRPDALLSGSDTLLFSAGKPRQRIPAISPIHRGVSQDYLPEELVRAVRQKEWLGWQVTVDSRGRVSWGTRERTFWGKNWHPLVLVSKKTPSIYLSQLRRKNIPYLVSGNRRVHLGVAMKKMYDELGVRCVASLGGGRLNGALLREGLVDEVSVLLIPMIVGGAETPTSFDASELGFADIPLVLNLVESKIQEDGSVWLRYIPGSRLRNSEASRPTKNRLWFHLPSVWSAGNTQRANHGQDQRRKRRPMGM